MPLFRFSIFCITPHTVFSQNISHACVDIKNFFREGLKSSFRQLPPAVIFNSKGNKNSVWVNATAQWANYWTLPVKFFCVCEEHRSLEPRKILSDFCWQCKSRISDSKQKNQLVVAFGLLTLKTPPTPCTATAELNCDLQKLPMKEKTDRFCCDPMSGLSSMC